MVVLLFYIYIYSFFFPPSSIVEVVYSTVYPGREGVVPIKGHGDKDKLLFSRRIYFIVSLPEVQCSNTSRLYFFRSHAIGSTYTQPHGGRTLLRVITRGGSKIKWGRDGYVSCNVQKKQKTNIADIFV